MKIIHKIADDGMWILLNSTPYQFAKEADIIEGTEVELISDQEKEEIDENNKNQKLEQCSLQQVMSNKLSEIEAYDNSDAVNSFIYNGIALWFSAEVRAGFKNSIESASLLGETTISIPTTAGVINLPLNDAKIMLAKIQRYADACFMVTM
jgi:hypothetical protein